MISKNQIKDIQSLQLKKNRDSKFLFIAEGIKTVLEIINKRPGIIQTVFSTIDFQKKHGTLLERKKVSFELVTEEELKKLSMQTSPNHVLSVCRYMEDQKINSQLSGEVCFYLDDIRDPGNFGTILRLAAWFGHTTLYCSKSSCDLYNPKVIQSAMGAFLTVDVVYKDLSELINMTEGPQVYGAVLNGQDLYSVDLSSGIIVIGNEANGISEQNLKLVTRPITIPAGSSDGAESLNAAMAASIIAAEFFRRGRS